jgi:hypothetical protein
LSRWHAVSVAGPDLFSNNDTATPEDRHTFALATLQLSRKCSLLCFPFDILDHGPNSLPS